MAGRFALASILILAGCAAVEDESLVDNPTYQAWGAPGWRLAIGDDIALRLGHNFVDDPVVSVIHRYPRRYARESGGVRRWRSGRGRGLITIEASPGPCRPADGSVYEHNVRVVTYRHDLRGCGGRLISTARP